LNVMKWARGRGYPLYEATCANAAHEGHFHVLEWLRKKKCPWDRRSCNSAACGGQLEILKWLRKEGCPWDSSNCCTNAAYYGHLSVVVWIMENGGDCNDGACTDCDCSLLNICIMAASGGSLEVLKWAVGEGCQITAGISRNAAMNGHTHILDWIAEMCDEKLGNQ
jgi:hypothetical protein